MVGLGALSTWLIILFVPAAYASPPTYSVDEFNDAVIQKRLDLLYGDTIRLRGYSIAEGEIQPGDDLRLTLYWEPLASTTMNYVEFVQVVGRHERVFGARDTHPGLGNLPTSAWIPGNIIVDTIPIPINRDTPTPGYFSINAGFYEPESGQRLPLVSGNGQPVPSSAIGWVRVLPLEAQGLYAPISLGVQFDDAIQLEACEHETGSVKLEWQALDEPGADYTVFVHLMNASGELIGQADHVPNEGLSPTRAWQAGDTVIDSFSMPARTWDSASRVFVGLYSPVTGQRVPAYGSSGELLPDSAVELPAECISG